MSSKDPKEKKPQTEKQIELKKKKEDIRKILKEHGVTFRLGMNAKGVKGYDEGLRGKKLVEYIMSKYANANSNGSVKAKTTRTKSVKPKNVNAYFAKAMKNIDEIIGKTETLAKTLKPKQSVAKSIKTRRNRISKVLENMGYQQRAESMKPKSMKTMRRATNKNYKYTVRNAKNIEIEDLKAQVAHLKRVCLSKKAYKESRYNMPSPPYKGKNTLERFLENE